MRGCDAFNEMDVEFMKREFINIVNHPEWREEYNIRFDRCLNPAGGNGREAKKVLARPYKKIHINDMCTNLEKEWNQLKTDVKKYNCKIVRTSVC